MKKKPRKPRDWQDKFMKLEVEKKFYYPSGAAIDVTITNSVMMTQRTLSLDKAKQIKAWLDKAIKYLEANNARRD